MRHTYSFLIINISCTEIFCRIFSFFARPKSFLFGRQPMRGIKKTIGELSLVMTLYASAIIKCDERLHIDACQVPHRFIGP